MICKECYSDNIRIIPLLEPEHCLYYLIDFIWDKTTHRWLKEEAPDGVCLLRLGHRIFGIVETYGCGQ
jgi:hypothetical protein